MTDSLVPMGPRNGSAPLAFPMTDPGTTDLSSAFAHFDGTSASGAFVPAVTIRAQNGAILARVFPTTELAAGDTADVTFAPFLRPLGGAATSAYATVQDEGAALTQRTILDFVGAGVTATDDAANTRTLITIPGATGDSWTTITKAADESVASSTVLQDDDELFFTATNGAIYVVELYAIFASPVGSTAPSLKLATGEVGSSSGMTLFYAITGASPGAATVVTMKTDGTTGQVALTNVANRMATANGFHAGGGGTFKVRWAQNVSNAGATIMRAGSILRYRRVL